MDNNILAQAIAYGAGFTFGLFQTILKDYIKAEWKAPAFVVLASAAMMGLYYGLQAGYEWLNVLIAVVSAAYALTGSVDFYKHDVKNEPRG